MLRYIIDVLSAIMASDIALDLLCILLVLDLRYTFFVPLAIVEIFSLPVFLYQAVFHTYEPVPAYYTRTKLRFHGWLVHCDIFFYERPPPPHPGKIRAPSSPRVSDHQWMLPGNPNKQFEYDQKAGRNATAVWEQAMGYDTPSPTKHSAGNTPAKRRRAQMVPYIPPSPPEQPKKPLTDMEVARCEVAHSKLKEMLDDMAEHQAHELSLTANISIKDAKEVLKASDGNFSRALHQINLLEKANDFAVYSGMYFDSARDCLEANDWDPAKAVQRLEDLHIRNQLQAAWFVHGLPGQSSEPQSTALNGATGRCINAPYTGSNDILLKTDKAARIQRVRDIMEVTDLHWSRFQASDPQGTCPFKGDLEGDCGQLKYEMDSIVEALTYRNQVWDEEIVSRADANQCLLRKIWFRKLGEELNKCSESHAQEAVQAMIKMNSIIPDEWNLQWS